MNRYHTFGKRIIAILIDGLVFLPIIVLNVWIMEAEVADLIYFSLFLFEFVVGILYNVLLHWKYGQTIGKMVAKVKVLDISERPISFSQALLRDIFYIAEGILRHSVMLVLYGVGYSRTSDLFVSIEQYFLIPMFIWVALDTLVCIKNRKYRALHDFIAGTVVVSLDISSEPNDGLHHEPPSPDLYDELRNYRNMIAS